MMRSSMRFVALCLASVLLAACRHKDKNAPLAFVPADTPYVMANLDVLNDATRQALFARADAQLPSQLAQLNSAADRVALTDPDGARLIRAFSAEFSGKTIESFASNVGLDTKGHSALYGLGLAPVMRFELSDPKAFDAFVTRLETAYGQKFDVAEIGGQPYRIHVFAASGTEAILATVGKQAVAALLPAQSTPGLLRLALGLDRPQKSLQDDGRLQDLAKAKGYKEWLVGDLDLSRALPLIFGGNDPLLTAMQKAHAEAESAKTGEPVANQLQNGPSCQAEAARIAARIPMISFGYTRLDARHQDGRLDIQLADDISKAFSGLQVALPGLGSAGTAPFDLSLAMPVAPLRAFWLDQADAVASKPFTCPALLDINDNFAKLGQAAQKAAIPPFGDLLGLRIMLDSLDTTQAAGMPKFTGRLLIASNNPAGLLAIGQLRAPALAQMKVSSDGKPTPLSGEMAAMMGQPAWLAMTKNVLALGYGPGEDLKLTQSLKDAEGDAGRMTRMHLAGPMYVQWLQLLQDKAEALAAASATLGTHDDSTAAAGANDSTAQAALNAKNSGAQIAAMRAQAERVLTIDAEMHIDSNGLVISSRTELK